MINPLRVGVIGCGTIAQIMHLPHISEYGEFELVALADINRPVLEAVANQYHVSNRYTDWQEMLAREDIDAVVICHSGSHRDSVIAALDAGKHIFVEKPLTWNLREAKEVACYAAQSDRVVQIGYHKLFDRATEYAEKQLKSIDDLGVARFTTLLSAGEFSKAPYRIHLGNGLVREGDYTLAPWDQYVQKRVEGLSGGALAPLVDEVLGSRKLNKQLRLGYGLLTIAVIHQIYMMFQLLGEPTRVVSAEIWREGMSCHILVAFPNDVRCIIDFHYLPNLNRYSEEYAFYGNHKRVILQFPAPYYRNFPSSVLVYDGKGELSSEQQVTVSYTEAFRNELLSFYRCVQEGQAPRCSVADAIRHANFVEQVITAVP